VGIYGQEGLRAVQASDYAIGEFKSVWRLVLVHGRWSYIRISEMILYFFYKNIVFTLPQFYYGMSSVLSGQSVFDDWYISLFNFIFTMCPLIVRAIFEQDVNFKEFIQADTDTNSQKKKIVKTNKFLKANFPKLYFIGQKNMIFTNLNFCRWLCQGALETLLLFLVIFYGIQDCTTDAHGYKADIWFHSIIYFTAVIFLVNLKLAMHTRYWIFLSWFAILITSLVAYIAYIWLGDMLSISVVQYTATRVFASPLFYLILPLSIILPFGFDYLLLAHESREKNIVNYYKDIIRNKVTVDKINDSEAAENIEMKVIENLNQVNEKNVEFTDVSLYSFEESPKKTNVILTRQMLLK
jgi:phospholipid-translocating ATPase